MISLGLLVSLLNPGVRSKLGSGWRLDPDHSDDSIWLFNDDGTKGTRLFSKDEIESNEYKSLFNARLLAVATGKTELEKING